jgi:Tol biopolymer transport system component
MHTPQLNGRIFEELALYRHDLSRIALYSRAVAVGTKLYISGELSPDGRYYAYKITNEFRDADYNRVTTAEWWLIDLEDPSFQSHSLDFHNRSEPIWSPDSRYLAYSDGENLSFYDVQEQQVVETYSVTGHEVFIQEWTDEGFWLIEQNQSSHETSLYWANFDGDRLESRFVLRDFMELIRPLEGTNLYLLNLYQDEGIVIINRDGEIETRVENLDDFFPSQTPDNRYLSYYADNNWLYLLNLETYESCKVFESQTDRNSIYDWRIIPQS